MTTMPWLRAAKTWIMRRGNGSGRVKSVWNVVTIGLRHSRTKSNTLIAPIAGIEAELVLQAHHVARAVVGRLRGETVRPRAAVVDDVDHARIVVAKRRRLLDRRNRGNRLARRHVHGVGRVPGEGCQSAFFRRISRYK